MKIYDQSKTNLLNKNDCDLQNGKLVEDYIILGKRLSNIEKVINPDNSVTITQYENENIVEKIYVYIPYTQKEKMVRELNDLELWFLKDYREIFEKCMRKISLQLLMKNGETPQQKLSELYLEAETKSARISELKNIIQTL